jgi:hypothetical protein
MLIQLKRSPNSQAPSSLSPGELAWVEGTKTLYIGLLSGGVLTIGGDGAGYLKGNQPIALAGDLTGSGTTSINAALSAIGPGGTGTKVTYDTKGRVTGSAGLQDTDIPTVGISKITGLQSALDSKPTLDATGKLSPSVLPPLAISDTFVVNSQAAMLALTAERGDIAIRTDILEDFILQGNDPTVLSNWQQFLHPAITSGGVQTVNSQTGPNVNLTGANIPFTPAGGISSTNVQAALAELDSKKLSANQNITFTGDATGSGTTAVTLTLAAQSGLVPGNYSKFTVNAKGLITAAAALTAADIPAIGISQVSGLQTALDSKMNANATIDGGTF